eukprot:1161628-Pelagomonas_calceolata.AAC.25
MHAWACLGLPTAQGRHAMETHAWACLGVSVAQGWHAMETHVLHVREARDGDICVACKGGK